MQVALPKGYRPLHHAPNGRLPGQRPRWSLASCGQRKLSFTPAARKRWVVLHRSRPPVLPSNHPSTTVTTDPTAGVSPTSTSSWCRGSAAGPTPTPSTGATQGSRKVRIRPKRKLTEAQRSAAADRLAAHRPERKPATRWALETTARRHHRLVLRAGQRMSRPTHPTTAGPGTVWHCTTSPGRRLTRSIPVALDAKAGNWTLAPTAGTTGGSSKSEPERSTGRRDADARHHPEHLTQAHWIRSPDRGDGEEPDRAVRAPPVTSETGVTSPRCGTRRRRSPVR